MIISLLIVIQLTHNQLNTWLFFFSVKTILNRQHESKLDHKNGMNASYRNTEQKNNTKSPCKWAAWSHLSIRCGTRAWPTRSSSPLEPFLCRTQASFSSRLMFLFETLVDPAKKIYQLIKRSKISFFPQIFRAHFIITKKIPKFNLL